MNHRLLITLLAISVFAVGGCSRPSEIRITGAVSEEGSFAGGEDQDAEADGLSDDDASETVDAAGADTEDVVSSAGSAQPEEEIAVYVCGAVKAPDVYQLPAGSRIRDAIYVAGGFSPQADESWLNQAEKLYDGEMIVIYTLEETARLEENGLRRGLSAGTSEDAGAQQSAAGSGGGQSSSGSKINLNTASREELMTLPGIGESKADSIIRYREESGLFASPEDVMNISGIKESVYSKIKDLITV